MAIFIKLKEKVKSFLFVLIPLLFVSFVVSLTSDYFAGQSVIHMSQKHGMKSDTCKNANLYFCYNPDELIGMNISFLSLFKSKKRVFEKQIPLDEVRTIFASSENEKVKIKDQNLTISYESSPFPGMFFVQNSNTKNSSKSQTGAIQNFVEPNKPQIEGNLRLMTIGGFWFYIGMASFIASGFSFIFPDFLCSLRSTNL